LLGQLSKHRRLRAYRDAVGFGMWIG